MLYPKSRKHLAIDSGMLENLSTGSVEKYDTQRFYKLETPFRSDNIESGPLHNMFATHLQEAAKKTSLIWV